MKSKIETLEKIVEQPFIKNKERPYLLHAVLIHDGLAENGHYYTYQYDRSIKGWWLINDHKVQLVEEKQVMQDALGVTSGYKNCCNLVYISKLIADQLD